MAGTPHSDDPVRWDVDDRRMNPWTRLYVTGMRLRRDDDAFEGAEHTREVAKEEQRSGDSAPTRWTRLRTDVRDERWGDMPVWVVRPRRREPVVRVIYLHGGGYVHPLTPDYWRLVRALVGAPAEVVVPAYPLAPDAQVDDVLPRLLEVHDRACEHVALPTVVMGDSAGGALTLVMGLLLRERPAEQHPAGLVALSPWLDARLDRDREAVSELETTDPMLAESGLRAAGRWWSGARGPGDPLVSPVEADLAGLPPIDVFIGDADILRPAVDDLAEHARRDGARMHVHEVSAMFHVWMTRAIPEGRRTRRELAELVAERARS